MILLTGFRPTSELILGPYAQSNIEVGLFYFETKCLSIWVYIKGSFKVDIKVIWQPPNLWKRKPPRTQLPVLESSNINLVGHQNSKEEKTRTTREMFIITDYTNGIHRSHTKN